MSNSQGVHNGVTILQFLITGKCNMTCGFCKHNVYMQNKDMDTKKQTELVRNALLTNADLKRVVWGGGEPLLAMKRMKGLIEMTKELKPQVYNQLLTNGRKLKLENVDYINKMFDQVTISFDGFRVGERTIMGLVEDNDYEALEAIAAIDNKHTWSVVTSDQLWTPRWYEDIIELHNSIAHLGFKTVGLLLDKTMPKPLFTDQVLNYVYGYKRIRENIIRLNLEYGARVDINMPGFFNGFSCTNCSEAIYLEPNGDMHRPEDTEMVTESGCNSLAKIIGVENYAYLNKFLRPIKEK